MASYRVQVATYGWLTHDQIVDTADAASDLVAEIACACYHAGEASGGAVILRADLPALFGAKVGDRLHPEEPIESGHCATCSRLISDHEDGYGRWHGCRGARLQSASVEPPSAVSRVPAERTSS